MPRLKERIAALEAASFAGHRNVIRLRCNDGEQDQALADYEMDHGPIDDRDMVILRVFVDPARMAA